MDSRRLPVGLSVFFVIMCALFGVILLWLGENPFYQSGKQGSTTLGVEIMGTQPAELLEVKLYAENSPPILMAPVDSGRFFVAEVPYGVLFSLHIKKKLADSKTESFCGQIGTFSDPDYTKTGRIRQQFLDYKSRNAQSYEVHLSDEQTSRSERSCYYPNVSL